LNRAAPSIYRQPVALDPAVHRRHRLQRLTDYSIAREIHAVPVTATEFPHAALEFPIVFVATGGRDGGGRPAMAPVALLGLRHGENLYLDGKRWDARYVPAYLRRYPFLTAALPASGGVNVLVDEAWSGFGEVSGEPLFEADDVPAPALRNAIDFLERYEHEAERTKAFCERLGRLGVLKEMKADATLPNGERISVDGFHTVDEERLRAFPDDTVLELWRSGVLMLIQMHLVSIVNIRHLVNRKAARVGARAVPEAAALQPDPQ
jgi:hypothetical protein